MDKFCRSLRKGEIVTVVQGLFNQARAHKKLSQYTDMTSEEITAFLQKVGPETSSMLLELDSKDLRMVCLEEQFVDGHAALQGWYLNS